MIQTWQLQPFQTAAVEVCYRMNLNPGEPVDWPDGSQQPMWMREALAMFQLKQRIELMTQTGML